MLNKDAVYKIVIKSIKEVNHILGRDKRIRTEKNADLYGGKSKLDSIGLVNLLIDLEQRLLSEGGLSISIMDARAFSLKNSPFRNITSLVDFIYEKGKSK